MTRRLLALGLIAGGCSHSNSLKSVGPMEDEPAARAYEERAQQLEQALSELSAGAKAPDCSLVCDLVGQVCELSRRICQISGRHADDPELAGRCASGEQRCQRSRQRVPPGCSCPAP